MAPDSFFTSRRALVAAAAAVACVLLTIAIVVAGDDGKADATARTSPTATASPGAPAPGTLALGVLTDAEVAKAPAQSPERTLMKFVQSVQYLDDRGAARLVDPAALKQAGPAFARAVSTVGGGFGKPDIKRVTVTGDSATIRTLLLSYRAGDPTPAAAQPATFYLRRFPEGWRLLDLRYLLRSSALIRAAAAAAKKG